MPGAAHTQRVLFYKLNIVFQMRKRMLRRVMPFQSETSEQWGQAWNWLAPNPNGVVQIGIKKIVYLFTHAITLPLTQTCAAPGTGLHTSIIISAAIATLKVTSHRLLNNCSMPVPFFFLLQMVSIPFNDSTIHHLHLTDEEMWPEQDHSSQSCEENPVPRDHIPSVIQGIWSLMVEKDKQLQSLLR